MGAAALINARNLAVEHNPFDAKVFGDPRNKISNSLEMVNDATKDVCRKPYMYLYDLGSTFGSAGMRVHPLNFEKWKNKSVFTDQAHCIGNLRRNIGNGRDGLTFPKISEEGRLFLADLLSQLISDRSRVVTMFEVAHMEMADHRNSADDWADVFTSKAREIINHSPCPK